MLEVDESVGVARPYARFCTSTSEKAPLPLCVSFRHVSWMTPMGAEDGLRMPAARDGFGRIAPRSLMEIPTANRDQ